MGQNDNQFSHIHTTLKASVAICWSSTLLMIESELDLISEMQNALKKIARDELYLHESKIDLLKDQSSFLKLFARFTELVNTQAPMLSVILLVKSNINNLCKIYPSDDPAIQSLKKNIKFYIEQHIVKSEFVKIYQLLDLETKDLQRKKRPFKCSIPHCNILENEVCRSKM